MFVEWGTSSSCICSVSRVIAAMSLPIVVVSKLIVQGGVLECLLGLRSFAIANQFIGLVFDANDVETIARPKAVDSVSISQRFFNFCSYSRNFC